MKFTLLRIRNLRCFESVDFVPAPAQSWLVGANGVGKTALIEAAHILSRGRSFRGGGVEALIRRGCTGFDIFAETRSEQGHVCRLGVTRNVDSSWGARIDGAELRSLQPLLEVCGVICFEPGTHALISGPAEERRQFLNWGVFHVEHDSLVCWRAYRRALLQRNVLVRASERSDQQLDPWEAELGRAALQMGQWRRHYLDALRPHLIRIALRFLPELGEPRLIYLPGWNDEFGLAEQLRRTRDIDIRRGYTRLGPHRADWSLVFERAPDRTHLSRGQAKLAALSCILAQAALYAECVGEWPVLCLDDLDSELDLVHRDGVLELLAQQSAQVWITATREPANDRVLGVDDGLFHVEQGIHRLSR